VVTSDPTQQLTAGAYTIVVYAYDKANNLTPLTTGFTVNGGAVGGLPAGPSLVESGVKLSTASFDASRLTIVLSFTGKIDAGSATDTSRYGVQVNGTEVTPETVSVGAGGTSVVLGLPQGTIARGD